MSRFQRKGVVVSGAAQGIGLGMAERFLAEGAGVVAFDRNEPKLHEQAARLGERYVPFDGDVSVRADCRGAVAACVERFGAIDVMCAHTGIADPLPLLDMTDEHWHRHMAVNVDGVMFCTVEAARAMVAAGRPGAIVCTTSINAWFVEETHAAYNVTKAAVWTFIRSAAIDLARHGIRVNGVAPGVADTPLAELVVHNERLAPEYLKTIPLGRFAQPVDVANCALFLASDEAAYVTGQTVVIDGGQTLGIPGDLEQAAEDTG
ncbi:MAG: family oxidoreductase [Frankiales bacterium]|nr:family oxidoreductase [Frankiales bacterium]